MKDWIKFLLFHVFYFIIVGAIGGLTWIWALKEYRISQGDMTDGQIDHALEVLQQSPGEFKKMIRLLDENRLPLNKQEEMLFAERQRLKEERDQHFNDVLIWNTYRESEQTKNREYKKSLDDLRAELDQRFVSLKDLDKRVKREANKILSEEYKQWIEIIRKMEPASAGIHMKDRDAKEIAEDLRQLKASMAGEILNALSAYAATIKDDIERDDFLNKLNDVRMLLRSEGLREE